ncbi:hypothetical protein [Xanthocytophaga agilis]|uniref:Uncharacterized protein n=1 Tax=Xanthocytophaga agilis TaxID=3048010 RepID=A0AAE3UEE3_9BACT|nr:hypothetical protein [Xanthocytophaga agilis]MDJ1499458.1 hypothetical protein [Xanthocytophaga agilis]
MEELHTKKKTLTLYSLFGVLVGVFVVQYFFRAPGLDKQLLNAASEINKTCPVMIDQETRLDNTFSTSKSDFRYNYTLVNRSKEEIDVAALENYIKPPLIKNIRTNPEMSLFRNNEITLTYTYKDKNGTFVLSLPIKPEEYK